MQSVTRCEENDDHSRNKNSTLFVVNKCKTKRLTEIIIQRKNGAIVGNSVIICLRYIPLYQAKQIKFIWPLMLCFYKINNCLLNSWIIVHHHTFYSSTIAEITLQTLFPETLAITLFWGHFALFPTKYFVFRPKYSDICIASITYTCSGSMPLNK